MPGEEVSLGERRVEQVCVLVRGYPGVGKTSIAMEVAKKLGYVLLIKDDVRAPTRAHDLLTRESLISAGVPQASAELVDSNPACYESLISIAKTQLRAGARGIVFDGPYGRQLEASRVAELAQDAQAPCILVDCTLDRETWAARLRSRREAQNTQQNGTTDSTHGHAMAHSALPQDPTLIEAHYPQGMQFQVDGVHSQVTIDCALDVHCNVDTIVKRIEQVIAG